MHPYRIVFSPRAVLTITALALVLTFTGCKKPAPATSDATMAAALQGRIAGESALSNESIQSSVENSVATLNGTVSNDAARSLAASDAAQVPGIKTVVNNLVVQQPTPAAPAVAVAPPPVSAVPAEPKRIPAYRERPARERPAPVVRRDAPVERPVQQADAVPQPQPRQEEPPPAPRPSPPPPPAFRDVTIPSGSVVPIRITQTLDSATTQQGDSFTGTLATDLIIDGAVALRQGTAVTGRVSAVQEAAHYKGNSLLTVELTSINRHGERLTVTTEPYSVQGKGRGKNTAEKVGGGAAVGAILGGILGGGKGAAVGAAAGGGLGAGANTITRGEQVQIPSESLIRFHLTNSLTLRVSTRETDSTTTNPDLQQRPAYQPPQ